MKHEHHFTPRTAFSRAGVSSNANAHANSNAQANAPAPSGASKRTVLVMGGKGGLMAHYREVVEERGLVLRHFEKRIPTGARHDIGKVALVVVMVGMVSHALRDHARELAGDARIVYLRTASVSALRAAVEDAG